MRDYIRSAVIAAILSACGGCATLQGLGKGDIGTVLQAANGALTPVTTQEVHAYLAAHPEEADTVRQACQTIRTQAEACLAGAQ